MSFQRDYIAAKIVREIARGESAMRRRKMLS